MIRIHDVAGWTRCVPGKEIVLAGDKGRKIILEANCPEPTRFDLVGGDDKVTFLAVIHGLDAIEFYSDDPHVVIAPTTDADFWVFTNDGEYVGYEPDRSPPEQGGIGGTYTRLMQRRARNPEFERLQARMRLNEWRRDQQQAAERAELLAMIAEARAAGANIDTGEIDGDDTAATGGAKGGASETGAVQSPPVDDKGTGGDAKPKS